jgi:DNA-binding IclR family transcriptional regulator
MSKGKYYFSKSLEKGLKILALFNKEAPVFTQSQIAKTLSLNMTSTYRYINTLVELGFLEKDPQSRQIRPSMQCLLFCTHLLRAADHLRMIREFVDRLHGEHNISIDIALAVDETIARLYHREAEETLIYRLPDVTKNCLHNTALGKAYLASLPEAAVSAMIEAMNLVPRTDKTIVDKAVLVTEIEKARAHGFAIADGEYLPGLVSIAAPLYEGAGEKGVGAVSFDFSVLQHNAADIRTMYGKLVTETAQWLSALLPPGETAGNTTGVR